MARLNAGGRTELGRVEIETTDTGDLYTDWRRTTFAVMSDGVILRKLDVRFKDTDLSKGYKHSYGWKGFAKLKFATTNPNIPELAAKWIAQMVSRGYKEAK